MLTVSVTFSLIILCFSIFIINKTNAADKLYMDKSCDNSPIVLDGDEMPGTWFSLTSSSKYKSNLNCQMKFKTAQPSQKMIITIEKMDIADSNKDGSCGGDSLKIYDGASTTGGSIMNKAPSEQCGTTATSFYVTKTNSVVFHFTSNAANEGSGFKIAIAVHFPLVAKCPQELGFYMCRNTNCISKALKCDSHNHCGDGSDEISCSIG